jgi:hypothetical protein
MTRKSRNSDETDREAETRVDRRSVLKAAGAATVGVGVVAGNASATDQFNFYGCSQVCTDVRGNCAVLAMESGGLRCEPITEPSNRNDPPVRDFDQTGTGVYCLSVDDVEGAIAVVGACDGQYFVPNRTHGPSVGGGNPSVESKTDECAENYAEYFPSGTVPAIGASCPCSCE